MYDAAADRDEVLLETPYGTIRIDRWFRGGLARLWDASDAEARASISHAVEAVKPPLLEPASLKRLALAELAQAERFVRYFGDLERVAHAHPSSVSLPPSPDFWDQVARSLITRHQHRDRMTGRALTAYVPRFYGMTLDDVFAAEVTEAEARLATARMRGFPSWEALLERAAAEGRGGASEWEVDPMRHAGRAIAAGDLNALRRVVEAHPELLHPTDWDVATRHNLLTSAIAHERRQGREAMARFSIGLPPRGSMASRRSTGSSAVTYT